MRNRVCPHELGEFPTAKCSFCSLIESKVLIIMNYLGIWVTVVMGTNLMRA